DILARWGGEEFILIITDIDEPGVLNLSERIRREVEAYACEYMGKVIGVTISAGLSQSADECDITELTLRADKALYTAKTGGKNSVVMWTPQRSRESI
ncbi:MAG: GGDEF domain-containing protein, partial [Oscillospiraceae bacterium]|nr:GGDEF domain-containing protein [Oscillospiraceae bacterium]